MGVQETALELAVRLVIADATMEKGLELETTEESDRKADDPDWNVVELIFRLSDEFVTYLEGGADDSDD